MESSDDVPSGWTAYLPKAEYTISLLVFAWALLPVGFMVMLLLFGRYPEVRFPLSAAALGMLALTYWTGLGQRQSAVREPKMVLAGAMLLIALVTLILIEFLALEEWWWVSFAAVIGVVPMLFVAMSHLAACTSPGLQRACKVNAAISVEALPGWTVHTAVWRQGELGWKVKDDVLSVVYGAMVDDQPMLRFEAFETGTNIPKGAFSEVNWDKILPGSNDPTQEE